MGYIHLVGIDPEARRRGVGRALYEEFARRASALGCTRLKAITTPGNQGSVDFHRALGYTVEQVQDYAGPGRARYVFTRASHQPELSSLPESSGLQADPSGATGFTLSGDEQHADRCGCRCRAATPCLFSLRTPTGSESKNPARA